MTQLTGINFYKLQKKGVVRRYKKRLSQKEFSEKQARIKKIAAVIDKKLNVEQNNQYLN